MVADASNKIREQLESQLTDNEQVAAPDDKLVTKLKIQIGLALRHRADDAILLLR